MKKPTHMVAKAKILPVSREGSWRAGRGRDREGAHWLGASRSRSSTEAVTERPGRSLPSSDAPSSSEMRTGTRCTILVKLPVAFSAGSTLNSAPVAGARLTTWPWKTSPGQNVGGNLHRLPGRMRGELAFLEIGVDPEAVRRDDGEKLRADRGEGAELRAAVADDAVDGRAQRGIAEIEPGRVAVGDRGGERGLRLLAFRVDHV